MIDLAISTSEIEYFLLVLIRMTCFMHMAPFYGESTVPSRVKVGLSVFLSYIVYVTVDHSDVVYSTVLQYAVLVMKEAVVGLLIGYSAAICMQLVSFAGRLVDMDIGLSAASLTDPTFHDSVTMTGMLYKYAFTILLITSGMYQYIIKAVIETYQLIPVAGINISVGNLLESFLSFISQYFMIGFRIALPVFAVIMVVNAVLGILAKVAPQLNLFAVGMQIKILIGLVVLYLSMWLLPTGAEMLFNEMKTMIVSMVKALM